MRACTTTDENTLKDQLHKQSKRIECCPPDVDQIEDVLLKTGASKAHAGIQKLGTNPGISACCTGKQGDNGEHFCAMADKSFLGNDNTLPTN